MRVLGHAPRLDGFWGSGGYRSSVLFSRLFAAVLVALGLTGGLLLAAAPAAHGWAPRLIDVRPNADAAPLPDPQARTWIVADAETGDILAAQDPHKHMPPASTLKTLTALALLPRLQPDSTYNATLQDADSEGSKVGIRPGVSYTVNELFQGLLMASGNDAANALSAAYGGRDETMAAMNAELKRLQTADTVAKNPSGLDVPGQRTSAFDLATIFREAIKDPQYRDLLSIKAVDFPGDGGAPVQIASENRLLQHDYPGIIGGKTGFTTLAGRTFVSAAEQGGRTLIVAILRADGKTEQASKALLDWGFANADKVTPVGQLPDALPRSAEPIARPAIQYDKAGLELPGQEPVISEVVTNDPSFTLSALETDQPVAAEGGLSILAMFAWLLLFLVAAVVALRVRAIRNIKRRRANAATARADLAAPGAEPGAKPGAAPGFETRQPVGIGTNPTRS